MLMLIGLFVVAAILSAVFTVPSVLLPLKYRPLVFALLFAILVTPTWAPASIAAVPVPFGIIIFMGLVGGTINEVFELVAIFWKWHTIAFALTFLTAYFSSKYLYERVLRKKPLVPKD